MTKQIQLTQGKVALVDDADYDLVNRFKWCADKIGRAYYAVRLVDNKNGKKFVFMHRFIMDAPKGLEVDHEDGDGLNNQRHNLRLATRLQNQRNRMHINKNNSSGFKGVTFNKQRNRWMAQLSLFYKHIHIGLFDTPEQAARAYDRKAIELFGAFASTNFPRENYTR